MLSVLMILAGAGDADPLRIGDHDRFLALAPFVQADTGLAGEAPGGSDIEGTDLNRARLYVTAGFGRVSGKVSTDLGEDRRVVEAFITYDPTDRLSFVAGQIDEPFSMTAIEGSRAQTFIDGAETNALVPGENLGLVAYWDGGDHAFAGGVFGGDLKTGAGQEGAGVSFRAVWNPTGRGKTVTHLGAALAARSGADFQAGFVSGVGAGLVQRPVLSVGSFEDVERIARGNVEAAFRRGPLLLQGEASVAGIEREGGEAVTAHAFYVSGSYFLAGEVRAYEVSSFGQVEPRLPVGDGGPGAIELAARLDGAELGADGETLRVTGAVNWHLSRRLRLSVNLSTAETHGGDQPREFSAAILRFQYAH